MSRLERSKASYRRAQERLSFEDKIRAVVRMQLVSRGLGFRGLPPWRLPRDERGNGR